jgi:hypothetical protein
MSPHQQIFKIHREKLKYNLMMTYEQEIDLKCQHIAQLGYPNQEILSKKSDRTPLSYANSYSKNLDKSNLSIKIRSSPTRSPSGHRKSSYEKRGKHKAYKKLSGAKNVSSRYEEKSSKENIFEYGSKSNCVAGKPPMKSGRRDASLERAKQYGNILANLCEDREGKKSSEGLGFITPHVFGEKDENL